MLPLPNKYKGESKYDKTNSANSVEHVSHANGSDPRDHCENENRAEDVPHKG
jgi:hypothetical protein